MSVWEFNKATAAQFPSKSSSTFGHHCALHFFTPFSPLSYSVEISGCMGTTVGGWIQSEKKYINITSGTV